MSKIKSDKTPHYELLYIISNKFSENELAPIVEKVRKIIGDNNGNITYSEEWGKKRLAYPVKSFYFGYYYLVEFDADGKNLSKIDKDLRLMSEILRHQIVVKKVKTAEAIAKDKKIAEKIAAKALSVGGERAAKEKSPLSPLTGGAGKEKIDLNKLDEKLDKILETSDLL